MSRIIALIYEVSLGAPFVVDIFTELYCQKNMNASYYIARVFKCHHHLVNQYSFNSFRVRRGRDKQLSPLQSKNKMQLYRSTFLFGLLGLTVFLL